MTPYTPSALLSSMHGDVAICVAGSSWAFIKVKIAPLGYDLDRIVGQLDNDKVDQQNWRASHRESVMVTTLVVLCTSKDITIAMSLSNHMLRERVLAVVFFWKTRVTIKPKPPR